MCIRQPFSISWFFPQSLVIHRLLSIFMDLSVLDISYKWSYIICNLLCIISFRVLFSRFLYVVACISTLFLFMAEYGRFPRWLSGKESACQCRRHRLSSWIRKIPWSRAQKPTLVFLPGDWWAKVHGASKSLTWLNMHICPHEHAQHHFTKSDWFIF